MNLLLKLLGCLVVAVALGLGSAWWLINAGLGSAVQNGAWATDPAIGATNADPYTRAAVARAGLLALNITETAYFTAVIDDSGEPLSTACTYKLTGATALATRWWSITAYGADHYLIPNEAKQYSQAMNSVSPRTSGGFEISVGPDAEGADAIATGYSGTGVGDPFSLTLRLYNPSSAIYDHLASVALPRIVKEGCQ
ncbi:MAG: DUF1214 domain-containing protein [Parvibaculum sp.]